MPAGEDGGAEMMVKEDVLKNPDVEVIFGLHIWSTAEIGKIEYRPKGIMAASQKFKLTIQGKQTHGSTPWTGKDPIFVASQIITGLNAIISRETNLTQDAAVISVGLIRGGVRYNIIPEEVEMIGTIRTLDYDMQNKINELIEFRVKSLAESYGTTAEIDINKGLPITYNDPELMDKMLPTLQRTAGKENVALTNAFTSAEDFSFYQKEIPGMFFFLGGMSKGMNPKDAPPHHTPDFYIDESGLLLGVKAMVNLTLDYSKSSSK